MSWTNTQKQIAVRACKAAGIEDEHRKLILLQFANSRFDTDGKQADQPSSTSKRLTNDDFEQFMAIIERQAGGQIALAKKNYSRCYWRNKAEDHLQRMRDLATRIANALEQSGLLGSDGKGLAGWIYKRVTDGRTDRLQELDYQDLHSLINGLRAYAKRHGLDRTAWETSAA